MTATVGRERQTEGGETDRESERVRERKGEREKGRVLKKRASVGRRDRLDK